jgi:outer membrane protein OmpA-like peptidoglycan-associated protein
MGGYDIFSSILQDNGTWSKPVNMGYPINTPNNDVFFVMSADGKHGYFASNQEGGVGQTDIYRITFLGEPKPTLLSFEDNLMASLNIPIKEKTIEKPIEIKKIRLTVLKGTISDSITSKPLEADIEIVDNSNGKLISTFKSNSSTGKYLLPLPSGINYGIVVKKEEYLFHSENVYIPDATNYQEINKDIKLLKVLKGSTIVLRNIFFDTGKSILREESNTELNRLVKLLNDNPTLKIEIQGHTDNIGGLEYNNTLSNNRSKAVVDYLIANGIDTKRLSYKGYGYSKPIATNQTPEGRQSNRRVQFEIL